jgi:SAM-dependent MidA family methyltransferase
VREYGAGRGTLARTILDGLQTERPDAYAAAMYELSDVNTRQIARALEILRDSGHGDHAQAATDEAITGVILANELLDAFPVHRLLYENHEIREAYVIWHDGWFAEEVGPISDQRLLLPLEGLSFAEGQRLEVSPAAWEWTLSICDIIERGFAILIDYGYPARELYDAQQRFDGTLRTYSRHLVSDDPFRRIGLQDLTAHVDFSAISAAAESCGCTELGLTSQAYFFAGLGIEEILLRVQQTATSAHEYLNARETLMHLLDPRGLGRFRVLALGKGVPVAPPLRGFSFVLY